MSDERDNLASAIGRYGRNYLAVQVQDAVEGSSDAQLAAIIPLIAEQIASCERGAIFDIGCGSGSFLQRLIESETFLNAKEWIYVGIDESFGLQKVQEVAFAAKVNRRIELYTLDEFYNSWEQVAPRQVVFCRNVLHELTIKQTAQLLHHVRTNLGDGDKFIIQDLMKFPEGERHNACWEPIHLTKCLTSTGFTLPVVTPQATKSGNAYFTLTAKSTMVDDFQLSDVEDAVQNARLAQWRDWVAADTTNPSLMTKRVDAVEAIDLDLQLTALTRQLADSGKLVTLPEDVSKRVRADQFTNLIQEAARFGLISTANIVDTSGFHFRERGSQLTILEEFLRSTSTLAQVHGGAGYGKTTLVNRLLTTRSYSKAIVRLDGKVVKTFWSFVESFFSQLNVRLAPEQISAIDNINIGNALPVISSYLNSHIKNIIVFYDNFDELLDSRHNINDKDLAVTLEAIVKRPGAKLICARKSEVIAPDLTKSCVGLPETVRVGRYNSDDTVRNVLDDYFDRVSANVNAYPDAILQAIDRHPLIAALAAKILHREGPQALNEPTFINQLKLKLRAELWNRMVDEGARPAVAAAAQLRIPVPSAMLEKLASRISIGIAQENELIYAQNDSRWRELLAVLGLFKLREVSPTDLLHFDTEQSDQFADVISLDRFEDTTALHLEIASLYRSTYKNDDDPKWVRESYFHQILASGGRAQSLPSMIGKYYSEELIASADYYFTKARDYKGALHLYEQASQIEALRENAEMRYASCLVRTGDSKAGDRVYSALIDKYPESIGHKTSYIDALIYVRDFPTAEAKLLTYGLKDQTFWISWQWGRVYGGLDQYDKAIDALKPLASKADGDPHFHVHLVRYLRAFGDFEGALAAINHAEKRFSNDVAVATAAAVEKLEHSTEGVKEQLEELFQSNQSNTRAAAALIKLAIKDKDIPRASKILFEARPHSPKSTQVLVDVSDADILTCRGQVDLAIKKLLELKPDPLVYEHLLKAMSYREKVRHSSMKAVEGEVASIPGLTRYSKNVPVQLALAELGHTIQSAVLINRSVDALDLTAFPKTMVNAVRLGDYFL